MSVLDDISFDAGAADAQAMRAAFTRHGGILVRGALDVAQLRTFREHIAALVRARLASAGHPPPDDEQDLDALFNRLCSLDRALGSSVYDKIKHLADYYDLIRAPGVTRVVHALLGTDLFQMPYDICLFRVDRPGEDRFTFDWHQDYPYNLISQRAVTAWIPLSDVTPDMGRLRIAPGSHQCIHPVRITQPGFKPGQGGGGRALELHEPDVDALEAQALEVPVDAGDVLFFHTLLMHRSGQNRSERARWVANPRYGDMLDPTLVARGWRSVDRNNFIIFHEIHPELAHLDQS